MDKGPTIDLGYTKITYERLAELERDAKRYQWLRNWLYHTDLPPTIWLNIVTTSEALDKMCDDEGVTIDG